MDNPKEWLGHQLQTLQEDEKRWLKTRRWLGMLRLASLALAFLLLWYFWPQGVLPASAAFAMGIALFIYFVNRDLKNAARIRNTATLIRINQQELDILRHHYSFLPEGKEWQPEAHAYANDLDIFGHASLFQYCNRCQSEQGMRLFVSWLLEPAPHEMILSRQAAVKELATLPQWRQQLQAHGIREKVTVAAEQSIHNWLQQENRFQHPSWKWLRVVMPAITLLSLGLHIAGIMSAGLFYPVLFLAFLVSLAISKRVMPVYQQLNRMAAQAATLAHSMQHIENEKFNSPLLLRVQGGFMDQKEKASGKVKRLITILDRMDYRLNPLVWIPMNTLLLWDLQQALELEKWKQQSRAGCLAWFASLATFESLASLANLAFNHPGWCFPVLSEEPGTFHATGLGHPLIAPEKRVVSEFESRGLPRISLITGSNMAGKSTFLRTVGVNIILAMAGGPVCAATLTVSNLRVISSMRVSDNLEESTSTFYAELKKLKYVIEAVNRKEPVILLLDEILRGTNSADRHTGSTALIRQLISQDAMALVATHDLQLAQLENDYPASIRNYHFDVQVDKEELFFDYRLKDGVCRSMNASLLMKKIGIMLEDQN